jgi:hypothetical protein
MAAYRRQPLEGGEIVVANVDALAPSQILGITELVLDRQG